MFNFIIVINNIEDLQFILHHTTQNYITILKKIEAEAMKENDIGKLLILLKQSQRIHNKIKNIQEILHILSQIYNQTPVLN